MLVEIYTYTYIFQMMGNEGVLAALQAVLVATRANEHRELSSGTEVLRCAQNALTMARLGRFHADSSCSAVAIARTRAIRLHNIATDNCADEKVYLLRQVRDALKHRAAPAQISRVMASLARDLGVAQTKPNIKIETVKIDEEIPVQFPLPSKQPCLICLDAYEIGQRISVCGTSEGGCGNYFHSDCLQR